jgi:hypothetical protein
MPEHSDTITAQPDAISGHTFQGMGDVHAKIPVGGSGQFVGAIPKSGANLNPGGGLNVSQSPIFGQGDQGSHAVHGNGHVMGGNASGITKNT